MKLVCIILIYLSSQYCISQAPNRPAMANISQPPLHDIDSYEKAGPYEIVRRPDGTLPLEQLDKARAWLWTHWNEHHISLLILTRYSVEGERSTYFYYIEPDREGRWRVAVKTESLEYNHRYNDPDCKRFNERFFSAYSLVRIELEAGKNGLRNEIALGEIRSPATYLISFRDENGKELAAF